MFGKCAYLFPDLIFVILGRTEPRGSRPKWGGAAWKFPLSSQYALGLLVRNVHIAILCAVTVCGMSPFYTEVTIT